MLNYYMESTKEYRDHKHADYFSNIQIFLIISLNTSKIPENPLLSLYIVMSNSSLHVPINIYG